MTIHLENDLGLPDACQRDYNAMAEAVADGRGAVARRLDAKIAGCNGGSECPLRLECRCFMGWVRSIFPSVRSDSGASEMAPAA